jgi:hypothetical protein
MNGAHRYGLLGPNILVFPLENIGNLKAPGADVFPAVFYKKNSGT